MDAPSCAASFRWKRTTVRDSRIRVSVRKDGVEETVMSRRAKALGEDVRELVVCGDEHRLENATGNTVTEFIRVAQDVPHL